MLVGFYGGPQLSWQNLFTRGKISFLTAKSILPWQNQLHDSKINFTNAKSIKPRQNQFLHGKINFTHNTINFYNTAKSILHMAQSISLTVKSISLKTKSFSLTAKSFSSTAKSFWLSGSRDIGSQSAMGVKPTWRSSLWSHESCFARAVEVVCFQQHIFACSVDKASRNLLMDVFKYTQCICRFYSATHPCA